MKIDIASDLHVDFHLKGLSGIKWGELKNKDSNILIICGDVSNVMGHANTVVKTCSEIYEHVFYVDGNHEHYASPHGVGENLKIFNQVFDEHFKNATLLDGINIKVIDETLFCGANFWFDFKIMEPHVSNEEQYAAWTNIKYEEVKSVDFSPLKGPSEWAFYQGNLLKDIILKAQDLNKIKNIVIATHTAPLYECLEYKPGNDRWNALSGAYGNSLGKEIIEIDKKEKIKLWCYGHTHQRKYLQHKHVDVVNNARGHENELPPWKLVQWEI